MTTPIGSRMKPATPARSLCVGGPWDGREDVLDVPSGIPTILPVDEPLGCDVRAEFVPDGR